MSAIASVLRRDGRRRASAVLPPLAFGAAFLGAWELFVRLRHIKPYLLPKPSSIWAQFHDNARLIERAASVSGANALIGLVAGTLLGSAVALVASRWSIVQRLITPMAVAVSVMPIVVLVSVFNNMFAITSQVPRRLMATLVVFFVVFVNVGKGLTQTDATQRELMRSYAASDWQVLRKVRIPNALGYFFTALKVAAPLSVITAFVAEYFGGPQDGLGYKITSSIANSKDAAGWAYVGGACLLGLVFYVASIVLERIAMPWQARRST